MSGIWAKVDVDFEEMFNTLDDDDKEFVANELIEWTTDRALVSELLDRGFVIHKDDGGEAVELTNDNYKDYV